MPSGVADDSAVINSLPSPFGTFGKAKYRVYGYGKEPFYSCVTTCRSEEEIFDMLMEWCERNFYMKDCDFARIVKIENGEEKILFKGNIFRNGN